MAHLSHRRKWYIGFVISLIIIITIFVTLHANFYWILGLILALTFLACYDILQKKHAILRNFPILGHIRFIAEFLRPEIQQYFIANDESERPFDRETRATIYRRSKGVSDTVAFGTNKDINSIGYEWVSHSLNPKAPSDVESRIIVGNSQCKQPYSASRLNISAMSFGSLSEPAIESLNLGAKKGKFYHNTGEGGLTKYHLNGADVVYQIGTGYFSCRTKEGGFSEENFRENALRKEIKMIELKLSQGAKPAHGGVLPKEKITPEIAEIRGVGMDKDVISPPAHKEFSTPEGLCHFIKKLRDLSDGKPVGFKLCIGKLSEFLAICKAIKKTNIIPDFITVDGAEGGTGAAPLEYSNNMGMPLQDALIFVHNALKGAGLRNDIKIIASAKVATGFDMVKRIAVGADICNSARAMMLALGCIQSKQCNLNSCPVGVATQNKRLSKAIDVQDKLERVYNFHKSTVHSLTEIIGAMGFYNPSDLRPSMVLRRIDEQNIKTYNEIYDYLEDGSFYSDPEKIPYPYKNYWEKAKAETFSI